jgi:Putative restriction endonuclease
VKTVVLASCTPEERAMLDERRRLDQDRLDEVWQGEYHMNPWPNRRHAILEIEFLNAITPAARAVGLIPSGGFNVGESDDYRAPDGGLHRERGAEVYNPTAALALEVVSPGDESWEKFDFYAAHRVDEVVIVDGDSNTVHWFALRDGVYTDVDRSDLLALDVATVVEAIDWS